MHYRLKNKGEYFIESNLRLVGLGKLDLDIDVNNYLSHWRVTTNKHTKSQVVTLSFIDGNITKAHDIPGQPTALPRGWESMPELAASGLWTTPTDLLLLVIAIMNSYQDDQQAFIFNYLTKDMMIKVQPSVFCLGPIVSDTEFIFSWRVK